MKNTNQLKVSYCGNPGSFGYFAVKQIFNDAISIPSATFKEAHELAVNGTCDYAVLPIENSFAGEVGEVIDLIHTSPLYINDIYEVNIVQNLIGIKGATIEDIKTVISHPQALHQCEEFIATHHLKTIPSENTAFAAKTVAELKNKEIGAIANSVCTEMFGLDLLKSNINTAHNNITRFAVMGKEKTILKDNSNAIFTLVVNNKPGALVSALNIFASLGINMQVLRSRPVKTTPWEYFFYIEVNSDIASIDEALKQIQKHCLQIKYVGAYTNKNNKGEKYE